MDYKKKYEQAFENIKKIKAANKDNKELVDFIEYQYPELKESEDERMRKQLLNWFKGCSWDTIDDGKLKREDIIAWLEKQDKQSEYNPYKATVESIVVMIEKYAHPSRDLQDFYNNIKIKCKDVIEYDNTWLEKQCEQKFTNKVESKFKVGDFILNGDITNEGKYEIFKILKVCLLWYDVENIYDGRQTMIPFTQEYTCKLWTIQDAKNGDILQANKCTLIFDSLTKDIDGNTVISSWYYCDTKTFYGTGTCKPDLWSIEGVVPATKKQCDILFYKMKEAGYEWDIEKKELKNIEQKSTRWSENDEKRCRSAIEHLENSISDTPSSLRPYVRQDIAWLESLKQKMKGE